MAKKATFSLKDRNGVFHYSFYLKDKRYRGTTKLTDKTEAENYTRELMRRTLTEITAEGFLPSEMPLCEIVTHYYQRKEREGCSVSTLNNFRKFSERLVEYFSPDRIIAEITQYEIEEWRDWLLDQKLQRKGHVDKNGQPKTLSKKTVRENIAYLSSIYHSYNMKNPASSVKRPQKSQAERVESMEFYSGEEINKLSDTCIQMEGEDGLEDFFYWFQLLAWTGCRSGEVQGIRFSDINFKDKILWVTADKTQHRRPLMLAGEGGTGKAWSLLLSLVDKALVHYWKKEGLDWREEQRQERKGTELESIGEFEVARRKYIEVYTDRPIFIKYEAWFRKSIKRVCKRAQIPYKTIHALRHSFASEALKSWEISLLAKWLGHSSIATTFEKYGHLTKTRPPRFWHGDEEHSTANGALFDR